MKLISAIFVLLVVGSIHAQASQLEVLKALNLARTNPKVVANWLRAKYIAKGTKGINGDENCYQEAYDYLLNLAPSTLISEDAGIDLAAYAHAKDQVEAGSFNHQTSDNTTPAARLQKFGTVSGTWAMTQMVALFSRSTAVPANDVIMLFASDCGVKSRKHRSALFDKAYLSAGVGVYNKEKKTMITLVFARGFTRAPITNEQLAAANIEGDGMYSGAGASFDTATFKKAGQTVIPGPQIHTAAKIQNPDDTNGDLGNLQDDKSVVCPDQINHEVLELRTIRSWTRTSQTCKRGEGAFTTSDHLDRTKPFAQKGRCFHRFRFCTASGAVFVFDREYKTKDAALSPVKDVINEVGNEIGRAHV